MGWGGVRTLEDTMINKKLLTQTKLVKLDKNYLKPEQASSSSSQPLRRSILHSDQALQKQHTRRTLLTSISSQSGYIIWRCQMGCRNMLGKFFSMVMMMYHALQIMAKLEPAIIEPFKCFIHSIMDKQNRTRIRTSKTCFKQKL